MNDETGGLRDLYQEVILDHHKRPRNFRALEGAAKAEGHNPLCGDQVAVYVAMDGDRIREIGFQGTGCAICCASASIMTEAVKGRTRAEAVALFERFHALVTRAPGEPLDETGLGKLAVFGQVCEFPMRVKCAILAWHTLKAAMVEGGGTVSTEGEAGA